MKINWGTGIVIAFILFICFILYFVITIATQKKYSYDLVDEEYYKTELKYQDEIDKLKNTQKLSSKITVNRSSNGFEIKFPSEIDKTTTGTVFFYRPSNKIIDFQMPLIIVNNEMNITHKNLISGYWNITIDFKSNTNEYLFKKLINY